MSGVRRRQTRAHCRFMRAMEALEMRPAGPCDPALSREVAVSCLEAAKAAAAVFAHDMARLRRSLTESQRRALDAMLAQSPE